MSLTVLSGIPTVLATNFPYARLAQMQPLGSLTLSLTPSQAQWRLLGETNWLNSGATIASLIATNYVLEFKSVAGYATPPLQTAVVRPGQNNSYSITYQASVNQACYAANPVLFSVATACSPAGRPYVYNGQLLSDSGYGSGFSSTPSMRLKIAVVAPIPNERINTASR